MKWLIYFKVASLETSSMVPLTCEHVTCKLVCSNSTEVWVTDLAVSVLKFDIEHIENHIKLRILDNQHQSMLTASLNYVNFETNILNNQ